MSTRSRQRADAETRRAPGIEAGQVSKSAGRSRSGLTSGTLSGELPENVRSLLDWLIDEELRRWQHEPQ